MNEAGKKRQPRLSLRQTGKYDKPLLELWIAADADHCGRSTAEFFMGLDEAGQPVPRTEALTLSDLQGPVMFARLQQERTLRVDIQFDAMALQEGTREEKLRTAQALALSLRWLIARAQKTGYERIAFESESELLVRFCQKRFGFASRPADRILILAQPKSAATPPAGMATVAEGN